MDVIKLLPDSVANQIAAGEVIQRPASVVKELVENAIDAGATHIVVNAVDAGKTEIQVVDDGRGMSETDARLSFERHATSKIRKADDLFALQTMGFRGEALASIAAVAQVELATRTADNELGTQIIIEGSRLVDQRMTACPHGCNFSVRNLFYNVPARRKFLKSNQTELSNIIQEMERITLVNEGIAFTLTHNGQQLSDIPASNRLQRIVNVFGRKMHDMLLPVDVQTSMGHISGYVGKPECAKKKGAHQFFFVNNRYMRHPYFHKAVLDAYEHLVPAGMQVPYFVYFDVEPGDIDVNIHPTKTEIKFENELAVWQILQAAVKEALGRFNAIPAIDFEQEAPNDIPAFVQEGGAMANIPVPDPVFDATYNPFNTYRRTSHSTPRQDVPSQAMHRATLPAEPTLELGLNDEPHEYMTKSVNHYQYKGQYILTAVKSGLMVVDQHRAHIRVLYDAARSRMAQHKSLSQGLLFPEVVTLSASDALLADEVMDHLNDAGFDIASLGGGSYSINSVPAGTEHADPASLLADILSSLRDNTSGMDEDINHRLSLTLARKQAVQVGEVMSNEEMETLLNQLFASPMPNYTPDGKPVLRIIQQEYFESLLSV